MERVLPGAEIAIVESGPGHSGVIPFLPLKPILPEAPAKEVAR
jgi:hypothetical protein